LESSKLKLEWPAGRRVGSREGLRSAGSRAGNRRLAGQQGAE